MKRRDLRHENSGQVLVITSLLVALILLSTGMYVVGTAMKVPKIGTGLVNSLPIYQPSIKSTLISALANVTNGGNRSILSTNLDELRSVIASHSYQSLVKIDCAPLNVTPYQDGIWISRNSNGQGISSACVNLVFSSSGFSTSSNSEYAANVTSAIGLTGHSLGIGDNLVQINLTVNLLNDGKPALAQNFVFSLQNNTEWVHVENPGINDFGNGTYAISFNAETNQISVPITVSVDCLDQRGILVGTSVQCSN